MPGGRPAYEVTDDILKKVEKFASLGLTHEQIAINLGWSYQTLKEKKRKYSSFLAAIERGKAKGISAVANVGFNNAMDGNQKAIEFYLKNRAPDQWEDVSKRVVSEGKPNARRNFSQFYDDEEA
jgi:predicted sulfurtransferase